MGKREGISKAKIKKTSSPFITIACDARTPSVEESTCNVPPNLNKEKNKVTHFLSIFISKATLTTFDCSDIEP